MNLVFNERKTAQAAAQLLSRHGGSMPYIVLIKLLYLADRRSLVETGYPVTGDRMVSMPQGPVLSRVYDTIAHGGFPQFHEQHRLWFEYISEPLGYDVSSQKSNPETDELSRYELELLGDVYSQFRGLDKWSLVEYVHTLPEWRDPDQSSIPIQPEEILRFAGIPQTEIDQIVASAEEAWRFADALTRAAK